MDQTVTCTRWLCSASKIGASLKRNRSSAPAADAWAENACHDGTTNKSPRATCQGRHPPPPPGGAAATGSGAPPHPAPPPSAAPRPPRRGQSPPPGPPPKTRPPPPPAGAAPPPGGGLTAP